MSDKIETKLHCRNCQWGWWVDVDKPDSKMYICPDCGADTFSYNKFRKEDVLEWCQREIEQLQSELKKCRKNIQRIATEVFKTYEFYLRAGDTNAESFRKIYDDLQALESK